MGLGTHTHTNTPNPLSFIMKEVEMGSGTEKKREKHGERGTDGRGAKTEMQVRDKRIK